MRSFGFAGEPAVDLLRRMLAFDPQRRCSAAEAASHEYLAGVAMGAADEQRRASLPQVASDASSGMDTERAEWPTGAGQAQAGERSLRHQPSSTWLRLLDGLELASGGALNAEKRPRSTDAGAQVVEAFALQCSPTRDCLSAAPTAHVSCEVRTAAIVTAAKTCRAASVR